MTPDEFIALVDESPLPWPFWINTNTHTVLYAARTLDGDAAVRWCNDSLDLAKAAPALAAAAIRLLRAAKDSTADECIGCGQPDIFIGETTHLPLCPLVALGAALPESLRP